METNSSINSQVSYKARSEEEEKESRHMTRKYPNGIKPENAHKKTTVPHDLYLWVWRTLCAQIREPARDFLKERLLPHGRRVVCDAFCVK